MTSLKDIKGYALSILNTKYNKNGEDYYDENGHCGNGLYVKIVNFWKNFNTDKDFIYLVSSKWESIIDLNGGRCYFLSDNKLQDMIYDYMKNTLNWSKSDFENILYNSTTFSEELLWKFDEKVEKEKPKNIWENFDFDNLDGHKARLYVNPNSKWSERYRIMAENQYLCENLGNVTGYIDEINRLKKENEYLKKEYFKLKDFLDKFLKLYKEYDEDR